MRFSFSLPVLRDTSNRDPFRQTYELAAIAETAGFDTATIGHHHFMPGNQSDPLTFMATVAARTDVLRVGTGIFQLPIHNPVRVAEQVACQFAGDIGVEALDGARRRIAEAEQVAAGVETDDEPAPGLDLGEGGARRRLGWDAGEGTQARRGVPAFRLGRGSRRTRCDRLA